MNLNVSCPACSAAGAPPQAELCLFSRPLVIQSVLYGLCDPAAYTALMAATTSADIAAEIEALITAGKIFVQRDTIVEALPELATTETVVGSLGEMDLTPAAATFTYKVQRDWAMTDPPPAASNIPNWGRTTQSQFLNWNSNNIAFVMVATQLGEILMFERPNFIGQTQNNAVPSSVKMSQTLQGDIGKQKSGWTVSVTFSQGAVLGQPLLDLAQFPTLKALVIY